MTRACKIDVFLMLEEMPILRVPDTWSKYWRRLAGVVDPVLKGGI
jgi:hypothetical protein